MKQLLLVFVCAYLVWPRLIKEYVDEAGIALQHHMGKHHVKDNKGISHLIGYNVHMLGEPKVTYLDNMTFIESIECDIDHTEMKITLNSTEGAQILFGMVMVNDKEKEFEAYVTGTDKWGCEHKKTDINTFIMRKVLGGYVEQENPKVVIFLTDMAYYDQLIKDGSIYVDKPEAVEDLPWDEGEGEGDVEAGYSKKVCLGYNAGASCEDAAKPINIFSNQYFDLACEDCYIGAEAYIFMEIHFSWFHLSKVAAGLKGMEVNAALELGMTAHAKWSAAYEKLFNVVEHATIVHFTVWFIPFNIWFQIPLDIRANANMQVVGNARMGAKAKLNIGDAYLQWTKKHHWEQVKPNPTFQWTPILEGDYNFAADASLAIIPSFDMHIDNLISSKLTIDPTLYADLHTEEKHDGQKSHQVLCADLKYQVFADWEATLGLNIPFKWIHLDKHFGPDRIFDTGEQKIIDDYCY